MVGLFEIEICTQCLSPLKKKKICFICVLGGALTVDDIFLLLLFPATRIDETPLIIYVTLYDIINREHGRLPNMFLPFRMSNRLWKKKSCCRTIRLHVSRRYTGLTVYT